MGGVLSFPSSRRPPYRIVWSSTALRSHREMPEETRNHVLDAVERLSFEPRPPHARSDRENARRWVVELLPGVRARYTVADERNFVMLLRVEHTG